MLRNTNHDIMIICTAYTSNPGQLVNILVHIIYTNYSSPMIRITIIALRTAYLLYLVCYLIIFCIILLLLIYFFAHTTQTSDGCYRMLFVLYIAHYFTMFFLTKMDQFLYGKSLPVCTPHDVEFTSHVRIRNVSALVNTTYQAFNCDAIH